MWKDTDDGRATVDLKEDLAREQTIVGELAIREGLEHID